MDSICTSRAKSIDFMSYTEEEKSRLCVTEIAHFHTNDDIDLPIASGINDPRMGSSEVDEICQSCGFNGFECPGHFGLLKLALPVYNPIFFTSLISLLKGSCFVCHHSICKNSLIKKFIFQKTLIDLNLVEESRNLEKIYQKLIQFVIIEKTPKNEIEKIIVKRLKRSYHKILKKNTNNICLFGKEISKISIDEKLNLMKIFFKNVFNDSSIKICNFCKFPVSKIKSEGHTTISVKLTNLYSYEILSEGYDTSLFPDFDYELVKNSTIKYCKDMNNILHLTPLDVFEHLNIFIEKNFKLMKIIFGRSDTVSLMNMFFINSICVTPPKFRPISVINDLKYENSRTILFKKIAICSHIIEELSSGQGIISRNLLAENVNRSFFSSSRFEKLQSAWRNLQTSVNVLYDGKLVKSKMGDLIGLRQILEKKEGLFRMNMMGKRVNQSARSVISPDPMLDIDEIGVPYVFASKLTFPARLNAINSQKLIEYVNNGPAKLPGATFVEINNRKIILFPENNWRNHSLSKSIADNTTGNIFVLRHLQDGDIVLMNRQPTLHRPSIMGHRVRILKKERTLRLHYANCKSYNADFDGDEMNLHFPQCELGRSEGYGIADCADQYLSPRDGKPLAGLIQDYMVTGVLMSIRDRFLTRSQYHNMIYFALIGTTDIVITIPPTIVKPIELWTGKQIISTLIMNCTPKNSYFLNMNGKSKITEKLWIKCSYQDKKMSDDQIIIRNGEVLSGIFDKNQFGASSYGIVHTFREIYGGKAAYRLLSVYGRSCINLLQISGFSLGLDDIINRTEFLESRSKLIEESRYAHSLYMKSVFGDNLSDSELKMSYMFSHLSKNESVLNQVDNHGKSLANDYQNKINKACSYGFTIKTFPSNSLQLMIQSGSKGTPVNAMQISSLLGQMELEGRRPPLMSSGRSLPCFESYDFSLRSCGFVESSFLGGLKPSEYFFHCMAGREGLVDTAVKTSRSGYLQRCLIKHLEGIFVDYNHSARDSDGSLIQFFYGEDACDVSSMQFLEDNKFEIFSMNSQMLSKSVNSKKALEMFSDPSALEYIKNIDFDKVENKMRNIPSPVTSIYPPYKYLGSVSDRFHCSVMKFIRNNLGSSLVDGKYSHREWQCSKNDFIKLMYLKYIKSLATPGDSVGILAAQSIGEPSTQMTLNTFHFAGRGETNVTLGIPRLREIFLVGGENIKTPSVNVKVFKNSISYEISEEIVSKFNPINFSKIINSVEINTEFSKIGNNLSKILIFKINFIKKRDIRLLNMKVKNIFHFVQNQLIRKIWQTLNRELRKKLKGAEIKQEKSALSKISVEEDDSEDINDKNENEISDNEDTSDDSILGSDADFENYEYEKSEDINEQNSQLFSKNKTNSNSKNLSNNSGKMKFDTKNMTCQFRIYLKASPYLIPTVPIIQKLFQKTLFNHSGDVSRCFIASNSSGKSLNIEGNLICELWPYAETLDLKSLYSNNIQKMAEYYGIEAARSVLLKEVKNVFEVYGIAVNSRHLSLLADYMTYHGSYRPCNRYGLFSNTSPIQKMSFESTIQFLKSSCTYHEFDSLLSPSARIVAGLPVNVGTGSFRIINK